MNHGGYAGWSVANVSLPGVNVASAPGGQGAAADGAADGPGAGAQPVASSRTAAASRRFAGNGVVTGAV
jgi:hypothetical protein